MPDFQYLKRRYENEQNKVDALLRDRAAIMADAHSADPPYDVGPTTLAARAFDTVAYIWLQHRYGYL